MSGRIDARFAGCAQEGRAGLVTFLTAGDPDLATSLALLAGLPAAGADLIEIGMPFTDPMADGPAIQAACLRALAAGHADDHARWTWSARFRDAGRDDADRADGLLQPDPRLRWRALPRRCRAAGVDGLIIVDLPPEEDAELCLPARAARARLHPPRHADHRRPPPAGRARRTLAASSTTSRSPASPAEGGRGRARGARGGRASSATPTCRWPSASASASRSRRPRSRASPMPPWSARRWSSWSARQPRRRWPGRAGAGAGGARQGARRWPRPSGVHAR